MQVKITPLLCGALWLLSSSVLANTVYLVRHAEKQNDGKDPALTACGLARAQALAAYFADMPLAAVYATSYQRTQQTAAAVATSKQLSVTNYDPRQSEQFAALLSAQTQPVLVVGHSNTVPQLVSLVSGIEMAALTEQDYSLLYQVVLGERGSVTLSHQTFACDEAVSE